jgi:CBS domain-containing protein
MARGFWSGSIGFGLVNEDHGGFMIESIRDVMTRSVETAAPGTTLRDAARKMMDFNIGSLPVCEGRRVVGIVTDRDIVVRGIAAGLDPALTPVNEIMTRDPITVRETSYLGEAEWIMREQQLRRLPVVDDKGNLVGYLAMGRVARTEELEEAGRLIRSISGDSTRRSKTA